MAVVLLRAIAILGGGINAIEFQTDAAALYPVRFRRLDHARADQAAGRRRKARGTAPRLKQRDSSSAVAPRIHSAQVPGE